MNQKPSGGRAPPDRCGSFGAPPDPITVLGGRMRPPGGVGEGGRERRAGEGREGRGRREGGKGNGLFSSPKPKTETPP